MLRRLRRRQRTREGSRERRLELLEQQVAHLEGLVEGLQDAVHRESVRRDHEAAEIHRQMEPGELSRTLSEEARKRGLE
jgi:hypothetical protein